MRFLDAVLDEYINNDLIVGYNLLGRRSDIDRLYEDCQKVGLLGKFEQALALLFPTSRGGNDQNYYNYNYNNNNNSNYSNRQKTRIQSSKILDMYSVASNKAIKGGLKQAGIEYRNNGLDCFMQGYIGEGKLDNMTGIQAQILNQSEKEQDIQTFIDYCQRDADLNMKALQKDNYNLMRIIKNVANILRVVDPGGQGFLKTANAGNVNNWWRTLFKNDPLFRMPPADSETMIDNEREKQRIKNLKESKKADGVGGGKTESQYGGGMVFDPIPGIYTFAASVDLNAMYPTIIDIFNLDPLTVNCDCCKDDPLARILPQIMNDINNIRIMKGLPARSFHYWICRKKRGRLADIFHTLIKLKKYFKDRNINLEKAVKLVMNSGYGILASVYFEFFFYKIPELVTGHARFIIYQLR